MSPAIKEGIKEGLRVALLAAVFSLLDALASENFDLKVLLVGSLVSVAKAVDKYLHKRTENEGWLRSGGLVNF